MICDFHLTATWIICSLPVFFLIWKTTLLILTSNCPSQNASSFWGISRSLLGSHLKSLCDTLLLHRSHRSRRFLFRDSWNCRAFGRWHMTWEKFEKVDRSIKKLVNFTRCRKIVWRKCLGYDYDDPIYECWNKIFWKKLFLKSIPRSL